MPLGHQELHVPADRLGRRKTECALGRGIEGLDGPLGVRRDDGFGHVPEDLIQLFPLFLDQVLGVLALGNVDGDGSDGLGGVVGTLDGEFDQQPVVRAPVLVHLDFLLDHFSGLQHPPLGGLQFFGL